MLVGQNRKTEVTQPNSPNHVGRSLLVLMVLACLFAIAPAYGQNRNTGEIRGMITDPSGARVPGTAVTIINTSTGVAVQAISDPAGVYDVSVQPGDYEVAVSKEGFKKFVRSGIVLHVQTITVNAVLEVGSTSQVVSVHAPVPLVQTDTSQLSTTITASTIEALPNVGRDWYQLTGQLPGVSPGGSAGTVSSGTAQDASGQGVGVNGGAGWQENWLVDGGVGTFAVSQNPDLLQVPLDAISEIDFSTSNFSAENGSGDAVFNVITKSGTNQFHGSLFEFVQNDKFEARNFFASSPTPLRWNEYGGTIGGPIRRNKAFFFFSFQRNPTNSTSPSFFTFPTAAMRGGDFSAAGLPTVYDPATLACANSVCTRTPFPNNLIPENRIDPVAAKIQNFLPMPNLSGLFNNFYYNSSSPTTTTWYNGKLDYNISSRNRLTGSVMVVPQSSASLSPTCPINCGGDTIRESQGQISDTWTLTPSVVNEFREAGVRETGTWFSDAVGKGYPQKIGLPNPPANAFPNITIDGTVPTGIVSGLTARLGFSTLTTSDDLTWIKGKHILKFGGEYNRWQDNLGWATVDAGDYDFSGIFTTNPAAGFSGGLGYADFMLGLPDSWSVSMSPETGLRSWNLQSFAQDDYKVKPHLTLNFGVRYQLQAGWTEEHNRIANFDPTLVNPATGTPGALCFAGQTFGGVYCPRAQQKTIADIFDPRVGFAWSPRSTWSVRGAYGIFTLMTGANSYTSGFAPGWAIQGSLTTTDNLTPVFPLSQGPPAGSIIYPTEAARNPAMLNGQGISYLPYHTSTPYMQQWHFDVQHQIRGSIVIDAGYVGSRGVHLLRSADMDQVPAQLLGPGNAQLNRPYPQYNGISANLFDGISNYNSFQLSGRKEFSHGLSFIVNYTYSKSLDSWTQPGWCCSADTWQNAYDWRANYGDSLTDAPHLFSGSFIYELPVGNGKAFLNRGGIANGVLGGWRLSSTFQAHSGLPYTPTMGTANLSGSLAGSWYPNRLTNGALSNPSINGWFNPNAFVQPAAFTFGNSGRDILRGPSWKDMSLSLAKNFRIRQLGESGQLQVRVDAFDVFNISNFGMPNSSIGAAGVGVISSANTSRNLQLGAKLTF